jgi:hypothetical protein
VRLLRNVDSFGNVQTVSPVAISSDVPLQPFGLACLRRASNVAPVLVVSEEARKRIVVVHLDASLVRGHVLNTLTWTGLQNPAALAACERSVYVADGKRVLTFVLPASEIGQQQDRRSGSDSDDEEEREVRPALHILRDGLKEVHGVAARCGVPRLGEQGHVVAIADAKDHRITILNVDSSGQRVVSSVRWGSGLRAAFYGPIECAAFNEPLGLAFDSSHALLVACNGGEEHGALVVITPTRFACQALEQLHRCFTACGFVPPNATAEQQQSRHLPIDQAIDSLQAASDWFERQCSERAALLGNHRGLAGPDGSFYWHSMKALTTSVTNMHLLVADLTAVGLTNREYVTLHALLDEGKVEVSFGEWVNASSIENPDVKEYAQAKPRLMRHALNRLGTPPFDDHQSSSAFYQAPHRSPIDTAMLWRRIRSWHAAHHPPRPSRTPSYGSAGTRSIALLLLADTLRCCANTAMAASFDWRPSGATHAV